MSKPLIIQIQKYSIHDGPGIRTTVFFKGCPLSCHWCHNPESQNYKKEMLFDREKCSGCGFCVNACEEHAISLSVSGTAQTDADRCILCGSCLDYCPGENREIAGRTYEIPELIELLIKDQPFYEQSGGGVTLSGGEVMTQDMNYIEELCRRLWENGISVVIDTCGYAPTEHFADILPYVDEFLYDIKLIDDEKHRYYTGQHNKLILENFEYLLRKKAVVRVRIPVIPGVNDDRTELQQIARYLKEKGAGRIHLLPYHDTGSGKYEKLGKPYPGEAFKVPQEERMEEIRSLFLEMGLSDTVIGG